MSELDKFKDVAGEVLRRQICDCCEEEWEETFFCETCSKLAADERLGDDEHAGPVDVCMNCCTCHLRNLPAPAPRPPDPPDDNLPF